MPPLDIVPASIFLMSNTYIIRTISNGYKSYNHIRTPIKIRQMALTHFMQIPSSHVTIFPQMVITLTRL